MRDGLHRSCTRLRHRIDTYPPALSGSFVFLVLLLLYMLTATYNWEQSPDPLAAAIPAWQFVVHGNLTLDAFEGGLLWFVDTGERIVSNRTPGVIFFAVPFYFLLGGTDPTSPTLAPAAVAAVTASAGAMTALHLVFRRLVSPSAAMAAALVAGVATSTWSVSADAMWSHGPNQLWLAAAMLGLATAHYTSSGISFALAVFTRPQLAVIPAVTGVWASVNRRSLLPAALVGVSATLGLAALVYYNLRIFGEPSLRGGYGQYVTDNLLGGTWLVYAESLAGTFVSPDRGILVMSPFLLTLLPGLRAAWRTAPLWVRSCAVGGVAYMLLQLRINYFSGGNNFYSYRLSIEMLTMAAPLLLLAYKEWTARTTRRQRTFSALLLLSIIIQWLGAAFYRIDYVERSAWANSKLWHAAQTAGPFTVGVVLLCAAFVWAGILNPPRTSRATPSAHP